MDSQSNEQNNQRFVDESEGLLTIQELDQIKASKTYGEAQRIILQAGKGTKLALKDFLLARDFRLTKFSLDTGTRPGPLNNATIQACQAGKVKDDCKVMLVSKHKRAKDGPAICPMLPELHKYMDISVRHIRPLFAKEESKSFREQSQKSKPSYTLYWHTVRRPLGTGTHVLILLKLAFKWHKSFNWEKNLSMAMLCLRSTSIHLQLPSPAELLYQQKLKSNLPLRIENHMPNRDQISQRLIERRQSMKYYHDRNAHDLSPLATYFVTFQEARKDG